MRVEAQHIPGNHANPVFLSACQTGECSGHGNSEELWHLFCGVPRWVWRLSWKHQLDWLHYVKPQAIWRSVILPSVIPHTSGQGNPLNEHCWTCLSGPIASVACAKLGNRATSIMGAVFVTVGFLVSMFATNVAFLYVSMGLIVGKFIFPNLKWYSTTKCNRAMSESVFKKKRKYSFSM